VRFKSLNRSFYANNHLLSRHLSLPLRRPVGDENACDGAATDSIVVSYIMVLQVAMVELHVMAHLKVTLIISLEQQQHSAINVQDVLVWPHSGDSMYGREDQLYVHEMLRLRSVYAPGRVHMVTIGKNGKNVFQVNPATTMPCPAPKWTDFR
jgi:hypothetical protein